MNVHIKLFAIALVLTGCSSTTENLLSPDGNIEIAFTLTDKGEHPTPQSTKATTSFFLLCWALCLKIRPR